MFARGFFELREHLDLAAFFRERETSSIEQLRKTSRGTQAEALVEGVFGDHRGLFKRVAEYSAVDHPEIYNRLAYRKYQELVGLMNRLQAEMQSDTRRTEDSIQILIDAPPPRREVEFKVDVYFPKEERYRSLTSVSPVVEALARRQFDDYVKKVRIFAAPSIAARLAHCDLDRRILEITS